MSNPNAPFVIYAMVTLDGVPVQDASVDAVLETSTGVRLPIHMLDDGSASAADTVANDGTYSQVIVPPADGSYKITVTAMKTKSSDAKTVGEIAGNTRLLPIKQDIPEEVTVPAPGGIFKVATYGNRIEVLNREKYKAVSYIFAEYTNTRRCKSVTVMLECNLSTGDWPHYKLEGR